MGGNNQPFVIHKEENNINPIFLQGNGIDRDIKNGCNGKGWREDASYTLNTIDRHAVCYSMDNERRRGCDEIIEQTPTITSRAGTGGNNIPVIKQRGTIVRRLTPLECERLQGFPDGWTDIGDWIDSSGKKHKGDADSPRYKALGNSIALPFWEWMAERILEQLKKDGVKNPTMASLFDGRGGFPRVYSRHGCEPVWASEIEEFPIAVTKKRFPDTKT